MKLAHFSDVHLGYEAGAARNAHGDNQRGADVVWALREVIDAILAEDPPLVIMSGDLSEGPRPANKYLVLAQRELARLASVTKEGFQRQVIVCEGNHDASSNLREGHYMDLFKTLPGLHVATGNISVFDLSQEKNADPSLADVVVTAVPHDALRTVKEHDPHPIEGRTNILVAHGVAESSELYRRAIGKEFSIPAWLMLREWDYVALGHFHAQGPVYPTGSPDNGAISNIWYAGSTETIGFSDQKGDKTSTRGWLSVEVVPNARPVVTPRRHKVRTMLSLAPFSCAGLTPDEITAGLVERLGTMDVAGAVVRQKVTDVSHDLWQLVDLGPVRAAGAQALMLRVDPMFSSAAGTDDPVELVGLGALPELLESLVVELVPEVDRQAVLSMARETLTSTLGADVDTLADDNEQEPDPVVESPGVSDVPAPVAALTDVAKSEDLVVDGVVVQRPADPKKALEELSKDLGLVMAQPSE